MAARKPIVKSSKELANLMAKVEGGKSEMKVGDSREFLSKLRAIEAGGYLLRRKSIFVMLRKESIQLALKKGKKNGKRN